MRILLGCWRLLFTVVVLAGLALPVAGADWQIDIVDGSGGGGWWTSIALDSNDIPHFSYESYHSQYYATWDVFADAWQSALVDDGGGDGGVFGPGNSLALDAMGRPNISYTRTLPEDARQLKYAQWDGANWQVQTVSGPGPYIEYTSIALDSFDRPRISYYERSSPTTTASLKYAAWTGASWQLQTVDPTGGRWSTLVLDSSDYPHISYYAGLGALRYAHWDGSNWQIDDVASDAAMQKTSLALDSLDRPHISYTANGDLMHAYWNGSIWQSEIVDDSPYVGKDSSIAINAQDHVYISYFDELNYVLKYAVWDGSDWQVETVDPLGGTGRWTDIALDSEGDPHISYTDVTNGYLKYAHFADELGPDPAIALSDPVDATIITGGSASLAVTVENPVAGSQDLNYTLSAEVTAGAATLDSVVPGGDTLAALDTEVNALDVTSTNLGLNEITFTATSDNATNSPQTIVATLTVLDHAAPLLAVSDGNGFAALTGTAGITADLTLSNGATDCADLDVNSLGSGVSGAVGDRLLAGGDTGTYTASVDTNTAGAYSHDFTLNVGDDHTLPGAAAAGDVSVTVTGTVYDPAALTANTATVLADGGSVSIANAAGPYRSSAFVDTIALTGGWTLDSLLVGAEIAAGSDAPGVTVAAPVAGKLNGDILTGTLSISLENNQSLLGAGDQDLGTLEWVLSHTVTGNVDSGTSLLDGGTDLGGQAVPWGMTSTGNTVAELIGGILSTQREVSMAFVTSPGTFRGLAGAGDTLSLTGLSPNPGDETFVLQMSYDPDSPLAQAVGQENLWIAWWNGSEWVNAVEGNLGGTATFHLGEFESALLSLGNYGIDPDTHVAWAVLNHNSDFTVGGFVPVPEPASASLLVMGVASVLVRGRRRKV